MPRVLRWCLGGALAVVLSFTGAGAATAATSPAPAHVSSAAAAAAAEDGTVEGETWSSPAVPVKCTRSGGTVTCTPESSSSSVAMTCYLGVPLGGETVTVCSSSKESQSQLNAASQTKLDYQWGCAQTWDACGLMESAAEAMAVQAIDAGGRAAAAISFTTKSALWTAAMGQWSFWVWAVWVVLLGAGVIGIGQAMFSGSPADVLAAVVRLGVTVPLVQASLWIMGVLSDAINELTLSLFASSDPFGTIMGLLFSGGQVNPITGVAAAGIVEIALMLTLLVFTARNVALAALVMVGPVAWMLFPMQAVGKQWVVRYVSAFAATLLTGPLMMSLLSFVTSGLRSATSLWDPAIWPFMLAIIMMCFAPLAVFALFSFAGASVVDGAASAAGQGVRNIGSQLSRRIPSPRLGGAGGGRPRVGGGPPSITGGGPRGSGGAPTPRSRPGSPTGGAPSGGSSPRRTARENAPQSAPAPRGGGARPMGGVGTPPSAYRGSGRSQH